MLLHHMNWILLGLSHWILSHPAPRTNCWQNWLLPYTACLHCLSVHWRCQKVKRWPVNGALHSYGSGAEGTLHLSIQYIYIYFCTTSNPLGLYYKQETFVQSDVFHEHFNGPHSKPSGQLLYSGKTWRGLNFGQNAIFYKKASLNLVIRDVDPQMSCHHSDRCKRVQAKPCLIENW